ncbi:zinc-ribbon domain-containing protein [Gemmata sp. JC717]|uniref:zinc-ribbon domain-containing protein n=1 Tax=Gemmata algarum TaxID=2975278 RepID=UPI0021BAEA92|nr:zinc-ribbon domain-containing protein [Gemmata algarum]MDY3551787.1 zinc-ribbon domain-containing protein [Gemmata algarum]
MLLTCPNCRSGLEVPDGTTALIRCPACTTVFAPADSLASEAEHEDGPRPRRRPRDEDEDDEDDRSRKRLTGRRTRRDEYDDGDDENRDFDPPDEDDERPRKRRRSAADDGLTPDERASRRAAFDRASWGSKLIQVSFGLFMLSMLFATGFFFQGAFTEPSGAIVVVAGLLGMFNWALGALGVALCLTGPRASGHLGYGVAAAIATAVHLFLLLILVVQGTESSALRVEGANVRWDMLPTQLNATMFYLTAVVYPDAQGIAPKGRMLLSMITGIAEMIRMVLILMLLSRLARAALDDELAHRCTRAAGRVSGGPALLAVLIFVFVAFMIETNAGVNMFTRVLFSTVHMGAYAILNGVILPSYMAARDVADACEEPFQSLIPQM